MTSRTIIQEIIASNFTNDELNQITEAIKYSRASLRENTKRDLSIGDWVSFTSSKTGQAMQGTVQKKAIKYITVQTPQNGTWRVPANMLTLVMT